MEVGNTRTGGPRPLSLMKATPLCRCRPGTDQVCGSILVPGPFIDRKMCEELPFREIWRPTPVARRIDPSQRSLQSPANVVGRRGWLDVVAASQMNEARVPPEGR